jgi:hypothetical protein
LFDVNHPETNWRCNITRVRSRWDTDTYSAKLATGIKIMYVYVFGAMFSYEVPASLQFCNLRVMFKAKMSMSLFLLSVAFTIFFSLIAIW